MPPPTPTSYHDSGLSAPSRMPSPGGEFEHRPEQLFRDRNLGHLKDTSFRRAKRYKKKSQKGKVY